MASTCNVRVDRQPVFRTCEQAGGTIKVDIPMKLAVLNVQQQAEVAILSCNILSSTATGHSIHMSGSSSTGCADVDVEEEGMPSCISTVITDAGGARVYLGKKVTDWGLLMASCVMVVVGMASGTLLGRLYFTHGGTHRWLSTWTQSVGWPINLVPLLLSYCWLSVRPTRLTPKLALIYAAMGCITAFDNLLYSWGISYLPASTNSLLCSCQLAFNAMFAYLVVGQKITAYVVNSVVTLTMGAVLLGIHAEDDRPEGTTKREYIVGFVVTVGGAALYALLLPLMELIYKKVVGRTSFVVVVEAQTAISLVATLICMVGMSVHNDYAALSQEAADFKLGPRLYTLTLAGCAVGWQLFFLGSAGIIFLTSSLMSCVFFTATLPLVPILAVVFFHDNFSALKGIAMLLSMWGFVSYIYGGYVSCRVRTASSRALSTSSPPATPQPAVASHKSAISPAIRLAVQTESRSL